MAESNRNRQDQCRPTPFLQEPLLGKLGYLANTDAAMEIINVTFEIPEGVDQYTAEFIATLKMLDSIRELGPLDCSITPEENRSAWNSQKERTSGEPSSLSFAHYKTSCLDDELNSIDTLFSMCNFENRKVETRDTTHVERKDIQQRN